MFQKLVAIDWSGAGRETDLVDLQILVAEADHWRPERPALSGGSASSSRSTRRWRRADCRQWLVERLQEDVPALVALDFGLGYPWNTDRALFGVDGWRPLVRALGDAYERHGSARAAALAINSLPRFGGHGPFRFNDSRNDFRFYRDHGVAYLRHTELAAPQAISQWYLGSGGAVGFHSISGMATLAELLRRREEGELDFVAWPFEQRRPDGRRHLLVEAYPAICPAVDTTCDGRPLDFDACRNSRDLRRQLRALGTNEHEHDAWKVLSWMIHHAQRDSLLDRFRIPPLPFGRIADVDFDRQIAMEGYILGLQ